MNPLMQTLQRLLGANTGANAGAFKALAAPLLVILVLAMMGEAFPGMHLAIDPGHATAKLSGAATIDPAFGLPAMWIEERQRENAQMAG